MKRFVIPFLLLFVLMALTVKQATPQRAAALYDHPSQADQMPPVRTFDPQANNVYHVHTPSELAQRSTTNYRVGYVLPKWWVGEGKPVLLKWEGRWHRAQTWRRSF